jgi:acyl-CoA synthetase (NDP forming)/GNAT superfamily N-acetyltransferase
MSMVRETGVYALLADGTTVQIRPAAPEDFEAVRAMHEAMSPNNSYLRFFNLSKLAPEREARRICTEPAPGQAALLALAGGEVVGVASYNPVRGHPEQAEVAFAVADHMHHRGIATLLLEHLVSLAARHGVKTFTAETLTENKAMLEVFSGAGLPVSRHYADGVFELSFPLPSDDGTALDSYLDAVAGREGRADAASLRHALAPESVAVIGASRRRDRAGRAIADNIRAAGYRGRLYTVNPRARQIGGERCLDSVLDLPEPVDLAVIAVPAAAVLDIAERCGQRGVHAVVVIAAGLDTAACADLLAVCRRHGMRLLGPASFGVAVPGLGLDATFAASHPAPGAAGLVMQSGGLGFAVVEHLSRLGIGISSFASVGRKLDVSGNDMLLWWEHDGVTRLAVLYLDSFGNPRKFARTARRVSATMPVLTVQAGRSEAGRQAVADAKGAMPLEPGAREALFEQAGVIATRGFGELIDATALLATQPVPAGRTVAIVTNVGSAGALAADACTELGLVVHRPHGLTRRRLRALVPATGAVTGPVNLTATTSAERFRQCLELLAAEPDVHAIVAIVLPTAATGDLVPAIARADLAVPCAAVVLSQPESVRLLPRPDGARPIPAYGSPEAAVAALARAAGYGAWRAEPRGRVPDFAGLEAADARALVHEYLHHAPDGGWLPAPKAADLLRCYGVPVSADVGVARAYGTELTVRVADDRTFGPLVILGADGDQAARLTPLTDTDADKLAGDAAPGAASPALSELLLRVARLADDLPEVTELDLSPVIALPHGLFAAGARVKVAPYEPQDPFLRRLR